MRNTIAKNRVERRKKKLTGSINLPFKTFYKFNEGGWWIFCWPDRMLHQSLQSCDLTHGRTEVKGVKSIITDGMTHFWQLSPWDGSLYQRVLKSRKKSTITLEAAQPHDIIMVSEPRLQGREVKEGNIGEETFLCLWIHSFLQFSFQISGSETMKFNTLNSLSKSISLSQFIYIFIQSFKNLQYTLNWTEIEFLVDKSNWIFSHYLFSLGHGVWKSEKKSHSTLRATLTFWVDKSWLKIQKMGHFGEFLKT